MNARLYMLKFWIPGSVVPKARPRVTRNGTYFPRRYQSWRCMAEVKIISSFEPDIQKILPIEKAEIRITLQGKHNGDPDNLAGSCLDSLVSAKVLLDDRLSCLPRLSIEHVSKGKTGVLIEVFPL